MQNEMKKIVIISLFLAIVQGGKSQGIVSLLKQMPDTIIPTISADVRTSMLEEIVKFESGTGLTSLQKEIKATALDKSCVDFTIVDAADFKFILLPSQDKDVDSLVCMITTINFENEESDRFTPKSLITLYDKEWNYISTQDFDFHSFVVDADGISQDRKNELLELVELCLISIDYVPATQGFLLHFNFPLNTKEEVQELKRILPDTTLKWNGRLFEK